MSTESVFIEQQLPEVLSKDELYNYFVQAKAGTKEAREKIILHNIRLVINQVFKKFFALPYDKNELVAIGLVGLIKAVDTFDITKNYEFTTYAGRCINNEILMYAKKNRKYLHDDSLNKALASDNDGNELLLEEVIVNPENDLEETILDNELLHEVRQQVQSLNNKDREIIKLYFGFYNNKRYSQREIGFILGMSQPHFSRNVTRIIKTISQQICDKNLIDKIGKRRKISVKNTINNSDDSQQKSNKIKLTNEYLKIRIQEYFKEIKSVSLLARHNILNTDDFIQILSFIETPVYSELLKILSLKEAIVIGLSLGYVTSENLSIKSLADFLNIDVCKIHQIIHKDLLLVQDQLNISECQPLTKEAAVKILSLVNQN